MVNAIMSKKQATLFQAWDAMKQQSQKKMNSSVDDLIILDDDEDEMLLQAMQLSLLEMDSASERDVAAIADNLPGFDAPAGRTWVYPTNYPCREYQFKIVEQALFNNTLVILPTGLGKTLIAAVVMYNFYRWYPEGKIIFMAPARPLVAQQIEACFNVMGIPQLDTVEMTGTLQPEARKHAWRKKRVFFLTPQIMTNDLSRGVCNASDVKCLVVDEAHKALGNHAYCQVVRELVKYTTQFRVLALSATPGSDLKAVQHVLTNLLISHVELRTDESPDIRPYTHSRNVEKIVVNPNEEMEKLLSRFLAVITPYVKRLEGRGAISAHDPSSLSKYGLVKLKEGFCQNPPQTMNKQKYGMIQADFALCISLYHAYELLSLHGSRSFYRYVLGILDGDKGQNCTKAELSRNTNFQEIVDDLREKYRDVQLQANTSASKLFQNSFTEQPKGDNTFVYGHPKLEKLEEIVISHFKKFQTDANAVGTRVMIFSQYRDSVHEITEMLQRHRPVVRAMSFIGQNSATATNRGFTQKMQIKVVREFREGGFNTLVSTCVGEEGLDIGEVDLIVCFDAPKSATRLVQRMGRTGRCRQGRIVVLVSKGKEERSYNQSLYNKSSIYRALSGGHAFSNLYPNNPRMVPLGIQPSCQRMHMTVGIYKEDEKKGTTLGKRASASKDGRVASGSEEILTDDEVAYWNKELKLNDDIEIPSYILHLPFHSLGNEMIPDKIGMEVDMKRHLSLNSWMPWQTEEQTIHRVEHSRRTLVLIETLKSIERRSDGEDFATPTTKAKKTGLHTWLKPKVCLMTPDEDFCSDNGLFRRRDDADDVVCVDLTLPETHEAVTNSIEKVRCFIKTPPKIETFPYSSMMQFDSIKISDIFRKPALLLSDSFQLSNESQMEDEEHSLGNCRKGIVPEPAESRFSKKINFKMDLGFSLEDLHMSDILNDEELSERKQNSPLELRQQVNNVVNPLEPCPMEEVGFSGGGSPNSLEEVIREENIHTNPNSKTCHINKQAVALNESNDEVFFNSRDELAAEQKAEKLLPMKEWGDDEPQLTSTPVKPPKINEKSIDCILDDSADEFLFKSSYLEKVEATPPRKTTLNASEKFSVTQLLSMINESSSSDSTDTIEDIVFPSPQSSRVSKCKPPATASAKFDLQFDLDSLLEESIPPSTKKKTGKVHNVLIGKVVPGTTSDLNTLARKKTSTTSTTSSENESLCKRKKHDILCHKKPERLNSNVKVDDPVVKSQFDLGRSILDIIDDDAVVTQSVCLGKTAECKDARAKRESDFGRIILDLLDDDTIATETFNLGMSQSTKANDQMSSLHVNFDGVSQSAPDVVENGNKAEDRKIAEGFVASCSKNTTGAISVGQKNVAEHGAKVYGERPQKNEARIETQKRQRVSKLSLKKDLTSNGQSKAKRLQIVAKTNKNVEHRVLEDEKSSDDEEVVNYRGRRRKVYLNVSDEESPKKAMQELSSESEDFVPNAKRLKPVPASSRHIAKEKTAIKRQVGKEFLEEEAELLGECHSDDESEGSSLNEYDSSFVAESSSVHHPDTDIHAVYLRSVRSPACGGKFKLQFDFDLNVNVFSQQPNPEEESSDYEEDSFCVRSRPEKRVRLRSKRDLKFRRRIVGPSSDEEEDVFKDRPSSRVTDPENLWLTKPPCSAAGSAAMGPKDAEPQAFTSLKERESRVHSTLENHCLTDCESTSDIVGKTKKVTTDLKGLVFVDTREIVNAQAVVSDLRATHYVKTAVRQVEGAGYVLSLRMAAERIRLGELSNGQNRKKILEKIRKMLHLFDRPCLVIEKDSVKPGEKAKTWSRSKYVDNTLCMLMKTKLKIFFTDSSAETAHLLSQLAIQEEEKGMGIFVSPDLSPEKEQVLQFYLSLPRVNICMAFSLLENVKSIKKITCCSLEELQKVGKMSLSRAKAIHEYLELKFSSVSVQATSTSA